ncbi:MAG: hypothetical protein SGPRY_009374 [Prymnesium sp.]
MVAVLIASDEQLCLLRVTLLADWSQGPSDLPGATEPHEAHKPMSARDVREQFNLLTRPLRKGDAAALLGAHKTLMEMGGMANEIGQTHAALRAFEAAFRLPSVRRSLVS